MDEKERRQEGHGGDEVLAQGGAVLTSSLNEFRVWTQSVRGGSCLRSLDLHAKIQEVRNQAPKNLGPSAQDGHPKEQLFSFA